MPELSRFYGIIITMFAEVGGRHHLPHFHASYQGQRATFKIENVGKLAGTLPKKQQRLVEAWAEIHQQELMEAWNLLQAGHTIEKIKPLK